MAETAYDKIAKELPLIKEVHLPMVADSTNETAIEVQTGIVPGSKTGWVIYGMRWRFQDLAEPHIPRPHGTVANGITCLQLCRGAVPATPVWMEAGDRELVMEDLLEVVLITEGVTAMTWPRVRMKRALTQLPELYLMFGSSADLTLISAATIEIYAEILYHVITAPPARAERQ